MITNRRSLLTLAIAAPLSAYAQSFPQNTIKIIVNFAAGGPLDVMARVLAQHLQTTLGRAVIVENVTGANGNLGAQALARSAPDGHTLLFTAENVITVSPHLYSKMGFDPNSDMEPVSLVGAFEQVLAVPASSGVRTVDEFIRKAKSGELTYASAGKGSPGHLSFLAFEKKAGFKATHVAYRGSAPAVNDLLAGHVNSAFVVIGSVRPHLQSGRLVALAVSGRERSPELPQVPTLEQAGISGFSLSFGYTILVPKRTSTEVQKFWEEKLHDSLKNPAVVERFAALDTRMINGNAAAARQWLAQSSARWKVTLKEANIQPE